MEQWPEITIQLISCELLLEYEKETLFSDLAKKLFGNRIVDSMRIDKKNNDLAARRFLSLLTIAIFNSSI